MGTSARDRLSAKKYDTLLATLAGRLGADEACALWVDAERRLDALLATTQGLSNKERMHVEGHIYPMCALFLAIAERCGEDEAAAVCADFMRESASAKGAALRRLLAVPGMRLVFMRAFGVIGARLFGREAGFGQQMHEATSHHLRMDITDCPYQRHCAAAGAPQIAPFFCANDDYVYGDLPGIAFRRSGTIARGNAVCDFDLSLT